jgi:hypothetical protein
MALLCSCQVSNICTLSADKTGSPERMFLEFYIFFFRIPDTKMLLVEGTKNSYHCDIFEEILAVRKNISSLLA